MLPALGPEPTRRGSIHGGVAGHFLHGVAPSAATSTSVGAAAALALARAAALLLLSVPCLVCSCYCSCSRCCSRSCSCLRCCSDLATLQSTESTFGSVDFQGVGGLAGVKEEPAAAGRGARRRGTPLSILGFRVGAVVAGGGGAVAWGSPEKKLGTGGPRGMAGAAADRRWGVFSGRAGRRTAGRGRRGAAVWPVVAGGSGGGG
ncbi:MAG: hypothetical protein DI610_11610 [Staphylococcus hominis]|nr:MAG: hypothetical protein DI610_11610 [Staphylococcus hominis]